MTWKPGESGNPNGYQGPRKHRRNQEVLDEMKEKGYRNPLITLSQLQHEAPEASIRVAAATAIAPYLHPKLQSIPTPRFIESPIEIPQFTSIGEATEFLARLAMMTAKGELDYGGANDLMALTKAYIDAMSSSDLEARVAALENQGQEDEDIPPDLPQPPGDG